MYTFKVFLVCVTYFFVTTNTTPSLLFQPKPSEPQTEIPIVPVWKYRLSGHNLLWPCASTRNIYTTTGRYISRHVIATRTILWQHFAFLALPRLKPGVPFTLGIIDLDKKDCWTSVAPWPSWSMQEEGNPNALQSVVDLFGDQKNILWILDVGIVNTLTQPIKRSHPKVVGFDIQTGTVCKSIDLNEITTCKSRLQYLVVDYDSDGNAYIYISDAGTNAIVVYDISQAKGYRVVLPSAVAPSKCRNDVLYIVLVKKSCGSTVLYFTFLGSSRLYSIKTEHLRQGKGSGAVVDVGQKPYEKEVVLLGTDNANSIFLRFKGESDIFMWNTETCFKPTNLLEVQHGCDCRLATQVTPGHKYMWVLESDFHNYINNTVGCNGASVVLHPVTREIDD